MRELGERHLHMYTYTYTYTYMYIYRKGLTEACGNSESGTDAHTSEKLRSTPGTAGARLELAASHSRSRIDQIRSLSFFTSTFFAAVANLRRGSHYVLFFC